MGLGLRIIIFITLLPFGNNAAANIDIDNSTLKRKVGTSAWYLEDVNSDISIEQLLNGKHDSNFKKSNTETLNFGFSGSSYWIRFNITFDSNLSEEKEWLLETAYPLLDNLSLYIPQKNGSYITSHSGDSIPFSARDIEYPNPVFRMPSAPGETVTHYLRVKSSSSLQIPLTIWSSSAFAENSGKKLLVLGAFYGIMMVMILYNFFIYLSIRNKSYLYYILYISSFTLFLASFNGLSFQYLWPNSPRWGNIAVPFFISLSGFGAIIFTRKFLDTAKITPHLDKVLIGIFSLSIISIISSFALSYQYAIRIAVAVALSFGIMVLISGTACLLKGLRIARFFLLAWVTLLLGIITHALLSLGLLPSNPITLYADQVGSVIEVILLSFALADRINNLRIEKERFQRQALSVLETSNRAKDEFLSTISHELRTPMNGIMNAMQLIRHTALNDEQNGLIHIANQSSGNMLTLIDNILGFTEAQAGSLKIKKEPFNIRNLVDLLASHYSQAASDKRLLFSADINRNIPDYLIGDEDKLQKLLGYFLDNSIKFTESGSVQLVLSLNPDSDNEDFKWVQFEIIDSGIGIEEKNQQQIFEVFQQADGSFSRNYGGLGIGLSIAKQVNALMGGTINFQSQVNIGTHVTLCIPMEEGVNTARPFALEEDLPPGDTRILIVEDNSTNQIILKKMVERYGYKAMVAENGAIALEAIACFTPHLILMDCQMPVMDGFTATKKIRLMEKPFCDIPIIAVTANVMTGDRQRCLESGMDDYIKKPTNKDILHSKIQQWRASQKQEAPNTGDDDKAA
ncbi:hypothetical protein A9Q99_18575 [Gammaproteobacteria bacterium 45_16_T64]|nr:hypothetical protein A9Q99_18575 [Gammaproteobacteria bacterium 45_16_T64]